MNNLKNSRLILQDINNLLLIIRNPELRTTRLTILGMTGLSFHLSTRCRAAGMGGPLSACDVKFKYGGTFGNKLGDNIASGL